MRTLCALAENAPADLISLNPESTCVYAVQGLSLTGLVLATGETFSQPLPARVEYISHQGDQSLLWGPEGAVRLSGSRQVSLDDEADPRPPGMISGAIMRGSWIVFPSDPAAPFSIYAGVQGVMRYGPVKQAGSVYSHSSQDFVALSREDGLFCSMDSTHSWWFEPSVLRWPCYLNGQTIGQVGRELVLRAMGES